MAEPFDQIVKKDIKSVYPDHENTIKSFFSGYNLIMDFPNCPVPEDKTIVFSAYIGSIEDAYSPTFSKLEVYGRMDPIPVYSRTGRSIKVDFDIPSQSLEHSREIANKLDKLVKNLYPSYHKSGSTNLISTSPLMRLRFSNIIFNPVRENLGLLGYLEGGVTISHKIKDLGVFSANAGEETYAKAYSLSLSFTVLHEDTPGYVITSGNTTFFSSKDRRMLFGRR